MGVHTAVASFPSLIQAHWPLGRLGTKEYTVVHAESVAKIRKVWLWRGWIFW